MILPYLEEETFQCPAERQRIPKSVHLARMARGYAKCSSCLHARTEGAIYPNRASSKTPKSLGDYAGLTIFDGGLRGVVGKQLTTRTIRNTIGAAFQHFVAKHETLAMNVPRSNPAEVNSGTFKVSLVVGSDERTSSPSVTKRTIETLRTLGCQVTDIGVVSKPAISFATTHLKADGGIYLTGSGSSASHSGFDFLHASGRPWSLKELSQLQETSSYTKPKRLTRHAGEIRAFDVMIPYTASFWRHFHALRPLTVRCSSQSAAIASLLAELFSELPCQLEFPNAELNDDRFDLGIQISEDGTAADFFDELGTHVAASSVTRLIREHIAREFPGRTVAIDAEADFSGTDDPDNAALIADNQGHWWFPDASQIPDAVLSLAFVLQSLSHSDRTFSERLSS